MIACSVPDIMPGDRSCRVTLFFVRKALLRGRRETMSPQTARSSAYKEKGDTPGTFSGFPVALPITGVASSALFGSDPVWYGTTLPAWNAQRFVAWFVKVHSKGFPTELLSAKKGLYPGTIRRFPVVWATTGLPGRFGSGVC